MYCVLVVLMGASFDSVVVVDCGELQPQPLLGERSVNDKSDTLFIGFRSLFMGSVVP